MTPRAIVAAFVVLVLTWTGTFLHDIDELDLHFLEPVLAQADQHDHHHGHSHFHDSANCGAPVMGPPEMHEHEPSVLSSVRSDQSVHVDRTAAIPHGRTAADEFVSKSSKCLASLERPPPEATKVPTYLLYHAMLI